MSDTAGQLEKLLSAVATLTDETASLKREFSDLKKKVNETKDIVEAWQAVKTGGKFLKWLGGVIAACVTIFASIKFGIVHMLGRVS